MRFLLVASEDAVSQHQRLVDTHAGERPYEVVSLAHARNGHMAEIEGNEVLLWPDMASAEDMGAFAIGLTLVCPIVKIIDVDGAALSVDAMLDASWDWARARRYFKEERRISEVKAPDKETVILNQPGDGRAANQPIQVTPGGLASGARFPDPFNAGSPEFPPADGPPPSADSPSPVEPAPFDDVPDSVYAEDAIQARRQLSSDEAYLPYVSHENAAGGPVWGHATDFWAGTEGSVREMAPELMPEALQDYASHEAETMGADRGIFGMDLIGFCCGALSDAIKLQVKPDNPRWMQPARLWICVVGSPSTKKTAVLKEIDGPAWALELSMRESSIEAGRKYEDAEDIYQKQRQEYIAKRAKNESCDEPQRPARPDKKRLLIGNATQEALDEILLDQNERGVLAVSDELASIFGGFNQYKKGGNDKESYLHGFDGGPYPIDRKGRAEMVKNHGWSIVGGTQPNKIRDIAVQIRLESDGMMQRFICYLPRLASEDMDRPAYHAGYEQFKTILGRLMDMEATAPVRFSAKAQQIRREFARWNWQLQKADFMGASLSSHIGKYDTFYARMCLAYHAIQCANQDNAHKWIGLEISEEIALQVMALFQECLYPHAAAFYNNVLDATNDVMLGVRDVASKMLAFDWKLVTPTLLAQEWWGWRKLKEHECKALLGVMCEAGWLNTDDKRGYVKGVGVKYRVNPRLREQFAEQIPIEVETQRELSERRASSNLKPRGKARE